MMNDNDDIDYYIITYILGYMYIRGAYGIIIILMDDIMINWV